MEIENPIAKERLSLEDRWRVIGFLQGMKECTGSFNFKQAGKFFHVAHTTISRLWNKYTEYGFVSSKKWIGRPTEIDEKKENDAIEMLKIPKTSTREVATKFKISHTSVENIAKSHDIVFKTFHVHEKISESIAANRLNFAKKYLNQGINNIVFTDESYFHIFRNTKGIWCQKDSNPIIRKINPNKALMIWGGISSRGKTNICINNFGFKVNSQNYTETLNNYLLPFIVKEEKLLHDNARSHVSRFTNSWLQEKEIEKIEFYPPYSPEFNPIEHIWKIIKDYVEKRNPQNLTDLEKFIKEGWLSISLETIQKIITQTFKEFEKCIQNNGY